MLRNLVSRASRLRQESRNIQPESRVHGARAYAKQMKPRKKIEESEIEESFLKGSGPGGQKIVRRTPSNGALDARYIFQYEIRIFAKLSVAKVKSS